MQILSRLLLTPGGGAGASLPSAEAALLSMSRQEFDSLVALAQSNHVIVRALERVQPLMLHMGDPIRSQWAADAVAIERSRIVNAVEWLRQICDAFEQQGLDVTVMKSLDHWPDLGSDLDLYTNATPEAVCALMSRRFGARIAQQSWGDRLACKWNFNLPGLPEPVEVHIGRLGQTGEQLRLASRLPGRARLVEMDNMTFRVPSASDRLMISTLQRMYRHFYFRLCDIVDSSALVTSGLVDYDDLRSSAELSGIWEGVATYLVIVSDYVQRYTGAGLPLPISVTESASFTGDVVYFGKGFLRIPILPQSAGLYGTQLAGLVRRQELQSSVRLGLLPGLAIAAAVGQKLTGSDKGIW